MSLNKYFSQSGEDGILEHILSTLPDSNKWAVEFGAWDGKHLSNVFHFISTADWNAILIESDLEKYNKLRSNMEDWPKAECINIIVSLENTLDEILSDTTIPYNFDVLSIDIDGMDYWIWDSLKEYNPKIVIIEYNYTLKDANVVLKYDSNYIYDSSADNYGASAPALISLGKSKGYDIIGQTRTNLIFIKTELNTFNILTNLKYRGSKRKIQDIFIIPGENQ